jgi:hypothetical protein
MPEEKQETKNQTIRTNKKPSKHSIRTNLTNTFLANFSFAVEVLGFAQRRHGESFLKKRSERKRRGERDREAETKATE